MTRLKEYFLKAEKEKWAIGQFNFHNPEQLAAIAETASELNSPVILGISERQSKITGLSETVALAAKYKEKLGYHIFLHLDHCHSFDYIKMAIDTGFDSVHFDGSHLTIEENILQAKKIVEYAHRKNLPVEGEMEAVKLVGEDSAGMTEPSIARQFLEETGVDTFAVVIGNFHGISESGINPALDLPRLEQIKKAVGKTPLVLHGGSGIRPSDITGAIERGIMKINIGTEIKQARNPFEIKEVVKNKIKLFGSFNKI